MEPFPVVEQLDVSESRLPHVFDVLEVSPVGHLLLEACEETFHAGIVVAPPPDALIEGIFPFSESIVR